MTRMIRNLTLALVVAAIVSGIFGGTKNAEAAAGSGQWFDFADGCSYLWDGYNYSEGACPRTDGGYDFYAPSNGQWVYSFSGGWLNNGGSWLLVQGQYYFFDAYGNLTNGNTDPLYPTTATIGAPTYGGLTDNVLVNQILIDSNNAIIGTILAPSCIEIVADVCYY